MCESSSSLSDLFGEDSSDEYIPPTTTDEEQEDVISLGRNKKRFLTQFNLSRRLWTDSSPSTSTQGENEESVNEVSVNITGHGHNIPSTIIFNLTTDDILEDTMLDTPKKKPRKVVSDPSKWKNIVRKQKYQAGQEHINVRGKEVPAKKVRNLKDCYRLCKFKCNSKMSNSERFELHKSYYSLPYNEKRHFLISTSERSLTSRPKSSENTKRKYSFRYFFTVKGEKFQVCKSFYLGTLDISQKPIYTAHSTKNTETNTPQPDKRGKSAPSRRIPIGDVEFARQHIKSFPKVESHYCRANTKREYIGSNLSVSKMYNLYSEKCNENTITPVKQSMYHKIFVTEFNLGFHKPKSDRCDMCEKYKMAVDTDTLTDKLKNEYNYHIDEKIAMREEVKRNREDEKTPILVFDLQNVITCPRADISSFFYKRKLNVYNMTAYFSTTKQVYCAIWNETMAGRGGNDLASAVRKILNVVADENDLTSLVTWSDSCVPQNRNSIMSNAILDFIRENGHIESITMKYSVPGHSCVQMVDSAHSVIERAMENSEFYSPVGLIRILKQANRKKPFRVIQMKESDFKDFASIAKMMNYKKVPFTKIASIKYSQTLHEVEYKTSHMAYEPINLASLKFDEKPARSVKKSNTNFSVNIFETRPKIEKKKEEVNDLKKKDIKSMFPLMPLQDREYYKVILKIKSE